VKCENCGEEIKETVVEEKVVKEWPSGVGPLGRWRRIRKTVEVSCKCGTKPRRDFEDDLIVHE
jgi:hypothetical protein